MRLTACRPGDLVLVNDGLEFYAKVVEAPARRRLVVQPLHGAQRAMRRDVSVRYVVAHWRRAGRTPATGGRDVVEAVR